MPCRQSKQVATNAVRRCSETQSPVRVLHPGGQSSFLSLCLPLKEGYKTFRQTSWRIVSHCQRVVADLPGSAIGCVTTVSPRDSHNVPDISSRYSSKLHLVLPPSMRFENAVKTAGAFELIQTVCGSSPCHQKHHRRSVPDVTIPQATVPRACVQDCRVGCMMADGLLSTYDQTLPWSFLENETDKENPG